MKSWPIAVKDGKVSNLSKFTASFDFLLDEFTQLRAKQESKFLDCPFPQPSRLFNLGG